LSAWEAGPETGRAERVATVGGGTGIITMKNQNGGVVIELLPSS
jgi:hypothetical protein